MSRVRPLNGGVPLCGHGLKCRILKGTVKKRVAVATYETPQKKMFAGVFEKLSLKLSFLWLSFVYLEKVSEKYGFINPEGGL
jgi:hypothetical protein